MISPAPSAVDPYFDYDDDCACACASLIQTCECISHWDIWLYDQCTWPDITHDGYCCHTDSGFAIGALITLIILMVLFCYLCCRNSAQKRSDATDALLPIKSWDGDEYEA